eukprot:scaffold353870_cov17-Prasinocladus_malaysianus.AAC.1
MLHARGNGLVHANNSISCDTNIFSKRGLSRCGHACRNAAKVYETHVSESSQMVEQGQQPGSGPEDSAQDILL